MKVSFYLKRPQAENRTAIYARIFYAQNETKYYPPDLNIEPEFWNKKEQRARQTVKFPQYATFNQTLSNISDTIENEILEYKRINGAIPTPPQLKSNLDAIFRPRKEEQQMTFNTFFEDFIKRSESGVRLNEKKGTPISKATIDDYKDAFSNIKKFQSFKKRQYDFADIDLRFYEDYKGYLTNEVQLKTNSIGNLIKILKVVLNDATELGYNDNHIFKNKRFKVVREETDSIYFTPNELSLIENLDLSDNTKYISFTEKKKGELHQVNVYYQILSRARDLFLIGAYTGMRYSDYSNINPKNITKNEFLEFTQQKTGQKIVIHIDEKVQAILKKYNWQIKSMEIGRLNKCLKGMCELIPEFKETFEKKYTKGGVKKIDNLPKYTQVTTHTGRRSFATNEYLAGTDTLLIMSATGHLTEREFMNYIKVTPMEQAQRLKELRDKRKAKA